MKKLINSQNGTILITFAILLIALLGFVALATEAGRWYLIKQEVSKSADAAALVGVKNIDPAKDPLTPTQDVGTENLPSGKFGTVSGSTSFTPSSPDGVKQIKVAGSATASGFFPKIVNIAQVPTPASGTAEKSNVEILLVIDRSYSMAPYWTDLNNAVNAFLLYFSGTQYRDRLGLILFGVNAMVLRSPNYGGLGWAIPTPPNIDVPYPSMPNSLDINMVSNIQNLYGWSLTGADGVNFGPRNMEDALIKARNQNWTTDTTNVTRYVVLFTHGYASAFTTRMTNSGSPEAQAGQTGCNGPYDTAYCWAYLNPGSPSNTTGIAKGVLYAQPDAYGNGFKVGYTAIGNPFNGYRNVGGPFWDYQLDYRDVGGLSLACTSPTGNPTVCDYNGRGYPNPGMVNFDYLGDGRPTRYFMEDPKSPYYYTGTITPGSAPCSNITMCRDYGIPMCDGCSLCDLCQSEDFWKDNSDYHWNTKFWILDGLHGEDPTYKATNFTGWPGGCTPAANWSDPRCGDNTPRPAYCAPHSYPSSPPQNKQCKIPKDTCMSGYLTWVAQGKANTAATNLKNITGGINVFVIGLGGGVDAATFKTYLGNFAGSSISGFPQLPSDSGCPSGVYFSSSSSDLDRTFRAVAQAILQHAQIKLVN
jgi:Flp pilus assembly protein TadG